MNKSIKNIIQISIGIIGSMTIILLLCLMLKYLYFEMKHCVLCQKNIPHKIHSSKIQKN